MSDNKKMKFIVTTNEETMGRLMCLGCNLVSHVGNQWIFLNNNKMSFSNLPDVAFTDKLFL